MSVNRSVWVNCDFCGDSWGSHGDFYETAAEARAVAHAGGWHHTQGGRDICDSCWEKGER